MDQPRIFNWCSVLLALLMLYLLHLLAYLSFYFVPIYFIVSRILKVAVPLLQELHAKIFEA
jgi:hypothetical protein